MAEAYGWRHHRARTGGLTSKGFADGFPPEVLVRGNRLIFVTLTADGSLTAGERAWIDDLDRIPDIEVYVITRGDLHLLATILTEAPKAPRGSASALDGAVDRSISVISAVRERSRAR